MSGYRRWLACSFCGKKELEVAKLVAGPRVCYLGRRVYICDSCVAIASRIMEDAGSQQLTTGEQPGVFKRLLGRIASAWRGRKGTSQSYAAV